MNLVRAYHTLNLVPFFTEILRSITSEVLRNLIGRYCVFVCGIKHEPIGSQSYSVIYAAFRYVVRCPGRDRGMTYLVYCNERAKKHIYKKDGIKDKTKQKTKI